MVKHRARAVMILGTSSDAGKSVVTTALCRHLSNAGVRVAPFKAQNMSLNSAATPEGLEIGRAQALQAEAARVTPSVDMNPILIKPTSDIGAQAIVHGRIWGCVAAGDYGGRNRERFWPAVVESYERLAAVQDVIVIEGAGSPAEINLREGDIVNMATAHLADARCLLVGDIDRGGVFASIYGTLALLDDADRARIDAFAINKFRGDVELLQPGIAMLERRIERPCLGVIPHLGAIGLDEEDSLPLERRRPREAWPGVRAGARLRIAVVALPHLANFTDFDALEEEPSVDLRYSTSPDELALADVAIVPGTKETIRDLQWLRAAGLDRALLDVARTRLLVGVCGGLQMLGRAIEDPHSVELGGSAQGLGVLDLYTVFARDKITIPVQGYSSPVGAEFTGYEIHVGDTAYARSLEPFAMIRRHGDPCERRDGARSADGRVMATYVHGIFAADSFRHEFLALARARSGLSPTSNYAAVASAREARLDRLAAAVASALDIASLFPELAVPA